MGSEERLRCHPPFIGGIVVSCTRLNVVVCHRGVAQRGIRRDKLCETYGIAHLYCIHQGNQARYYAAALLWFAAVVVVSCCCRLSWCVIICVVVGFTACTCL